MKRIENLSLGMVFVAMLNGSVAARDAAIPGQRPMRDWAAEEFKNVTLSDNNELYESAAVDTYCLVWYTFEQMNWQGWTRIDETAPKGTFFHVDDFAGLGGGSYGGLFPLEGTKSIWCGARPSTTDLYLCSWSKAPGYGNRWNQIFRTNAFSFVGRITLSFKAHYDCEPGYDFIRVEYDAGGDNWAEIASFNGRGDTIAEYSLTLPHASTKLRFHFTSDAVWSDQDGIYDSDGGCIIDSIHIRDNVALNNYESFESAAVGATSAGIWIAAPEVSYGSFAGLKNNLTDKDPFADNFATQLVYFLGSPNPSSSYPGLYDTPFCVGSGGITAPCQNEIAVSPVIDMTKYSAACNNVQNGTIPAGDLPLLGGATLRFTVYRDLPLQNLVFYIWHVRKIVNGCPGLWLDDNNLYYGSERKYIFATYDVSRFIAGDDPVQIALGVIDMCDAWYLVNGNCAAHTPSPWIDNVRLYRYKTVGPQWSYRDFDLFQDNFPENEYDIESYVRADAANDINTNDNPVIRSGDSIVVDAASLIGGGIAAGPMGGPAVYIHVKASYIGHAPGKPTLYGPSLAGGVVTGLTGSQYTINFNYISDDGAWTIIQCDTARFADGGIYPDKYMVDLNDALFTRGYMIEYYFTARDAAGVETALPRWARSHGPYFEFTCLPTKNSDILFVDDATGIGSFAGSVENYWMPVFEAVLAPPENNVDKYDVNGPTSGVSNGLGSRAKTKQLVDWYYTIVWDSGHLDWCTISDGTTNSDKSNDCQLLVDWMSEAEHHCGLWICGSGVTYDLTINDLLSSPASALMSTWCNVALTNTSYFEVTGGSSGGGILNPLLSGDPDGIFYHGGIPDHTYLCAYEDYPTIDNHEPIGGTPPAFNYPKPGKGLRAADVEYHAAIQSSTLNSNDQTVRTMWFAFSYEDLRDDRSGPPIDRFEIARDVFSWMQGMVNSDITDSKETPVAYSLAQNIPNPFNPVTTIKYGMKEKGFVSLEIYNVAGQLVRTLVKEVKLAGSYSIPWNGRNDRGAEVASGIYFYKMETAGFRETKKMVLLR